MKSELGLGIYTSSDISSILMLPTYKIRRWINNFWDTHFAEIQNSKYSWGNGKDKAVNFHTFIEILIFNKLLEHGISYKKILTAHKTISEDFNMSFPFANTKILASDKNIFYYINNETIIKADESKQIGIKHILEHFYDRIDFDDDNYAKRYWPLGKDKSVVIDPKHQFGQPTINGTNILIDTIIYSYYKGGESLKVIASLYELKLSQVEDAISYMTRKVA
ncbi:MAG: DUF433 domain-containing protein [Candidatus Kapabacteria bacterium]|nr:DUF433 domain-containing protein [Candidatus Kapabacteria bacterium]